MTEKERADLLGSGEDIAELSDRINQDGLIQPVVLNQTGPDEYRIVAGHMRVEACKRLGWRSLPAIVRQRE